MSTPGSSGGPGEVDPVTFEVLRHRLAGINDEAAIMIARVSGSQVVTEASDFNTALMTAAGEVVVCGNYVLVHGCALGGVVRSILADYTENPGIGPGDMFLTNDPYVTGTHQADVAVVAPIFHGARLVAWCGAVVHQSDVGGPVAGSIAVGARSIFEEPIPVAPLRIVEGGVVRRDLEREYLIRSRTPDLNALDLRGQVAANGLHVRRIVELCDRYGPDTFVSTLQRMVDTAEAALRSRLADLPDGRWRHVSFIEHDGTEDRVYAIRLTMTKSGDRLGLDFSGSDDQAPALINAPAPTLTNTAISAVMTLLGYGAVPWVMAAFERVTDLSSREGSVVHARWPAGVSLCTSAAGQEIRTCVNICVSRLLDAAADPQARHRVLAACMTASPGQTIAGRWAGGEFFGTMLLDAMLGGGGARSFGDGLSTSGLLHVPGGTCANIEVNELNYPLLYLWRREQPDSGGPGRFRGGLGASHAYRLHGARSPIACTLWGSSMEQPGASGVAGGEPGQPNAFLLVRGSSEDPSVLVATPQSSWPGDRQVPAPKVLGSLADGDVLVSWCSGGGGFGDPLERPVEEVLADVDEGLVSPEGALADYGVVVRPAATDPMGWELDRRATQAARRARLRRRLDGRPPTPAPSGTALADGTRPVSGGLAVADEAGRWGLVCRSCGARLEIVDGDLTSSLAVEVLPAHYRWPLAAQLRGSARFVVRRYCCPSCARQLDVEVNLAGSPPLRSVELPSATSPDAAGDTRG